MHPSAWSKGREHAQSPVLEGARRGVRPRSPSTGSAKGLEELRGQRSWGAFRPFGRQWLLGEAGCSLLPRACPASLDWEWGGRGPHSEPCPSLPRVCVWGGFFSGPPAASSPSPSLAFLFRASAKRGGGGCCVLPLTETPGPLASFLLCQPPGLEGIRRAGQGRSAEGAPAGLGAGRQPRRPVPGRARAPVQQLLSREGQQSWKSRAIQLIFYFNYLKQIRKLCFSPEKFEKQDKGSEWKLQFVKASALMWISLNPQD